MENLPSRPPLLYAALECKVSLLARFQVILATHYNDVLVVFVRPTIIQLWHALVHSILKNAEKIGQRLKPDEPSYKKSRVIKGTNLFSRMMSCCSGGREDLSALE
jgi:hypothetical protein